MVVISAVSGHIGAAIAVGLFATLETGAVAWGRLLIAAVIMLAWRRPWHLLTWQAIKLPAAFGVVLGGTVMAFYYSIELIPLGASMAIQFLGPISLAVFLGRGLRTIFAAMLAIGGVFCISWIGIDLSSPGALLGIGFALLGAFIWVSYIILGGKIAASGNGLDGLAVALGFAALFYIPFAGADLPRLFTSPSLLITLVAVAILSSVLSYAIDQIVLPKILASTYSLLTALSPATSLVVGVFMLGQIPSMGELVGLICISIAVVLATKPADAPETAEVPTIAGTTTEDGRLVELKPSDEIVDADDVLTADVLTPGHSDVVRKTRMGMPHLPMRPVRSAARLRAGARQRSLARRRSHAHQMQRAPKSASQRTSKRQLAGKI